MVRVGPAAPTIPGLPVSPASQERYLKSYRGDPTNCILRYIFLNSGILEGLGCFLSPTIAAVQLFNFFWVHAKLFTEP